MMMGKVIIAVVVLIFVAWHIGGLMRGRTRR